MAHLSTIGVDLAKNVIQVSVVTPSGRELMNKSLSRNQFGEFLATHKPSLVAFAACDSAHHWASTSAWSSSSDSPSPFSRALSPGPQE
jgi:hypothetical protein